MIRQEEGNIITGSDQAIYMLTFSQSVRFTGTT